MEQTLLRLWRWPMRRQTDDLDGLCLQIKSLVVQNSFRLCYMFLIFFSLKSMNRLVGFHFISQQKSIKCCWHGKFNLIFAYSIFITYISDQEQYGDASSKIDKIKGSWGVRPKMNSFMTEKKSHEVETMANVVATLAMQCNIKQVRFYMISHS